MKFIAACQCCPQISRFFNCDLPALPISHACTHLQTLEATLNSRYTRNYSVSDTPQRVDGTTGTAEDRKIAGHLQDAMMIGNFPALEELKLRGANETTSRLSLQECIEGQGIHGLYEEAG